MGMTEKIALINELTLCLAEDYHIDDLRGLKGKVTTIMQGYHVLVSDESFKGEDLSTEYLLKKFGEAKKASGMSENTLTQYRLAISILEKDTDKLVSDIEATDILNFFIRYNKKVSSVTVRNKYNLLSSFFNWCYLHKFIPHNPITTVEPPKADVLYKSPLTPMGLEAIKSTCERQPTQESARDMAIVHFLVSTGCRISELCNIKIKDVDFAGKACIVLGKGRKQRPVTLSEPAIFRLKEYLKTRKEVGAECPLFANIRGKEKRMSRDSAQRLIEKLRKESHTDVTWHAFRRYYATELRKRNVSVQMIARSLGHANLNQINRYSLYSNAEMVADIQSAI